MKKIILILLILILPNVLYAEQKSYGKLLNVKYVKNYDGDTITFNIKQVHPIIGDKVNIRIASIDAAEIKGKCTKEKNLAGEAKAFVWGQLIHAKHINLLNVKRGKYFRIVADVEVDKNDLGKLLIDKGYAIEYNGGTKTKDWCE